MYSNSNSYLGGNNSLRPGAQQYGNSFGNGQQPQQQQPGQPQQSPFAPQPTGYGQAPLNQQFTGFPGPQGMMQPQQTGMPLQQGGPQQGLQPQFTGYPGQPQPQQNFQTGAPPMPQMPQQYQQQFNQQQQPPQQQQPQNSYSSPTVQAPPSIAPPPAKPMAAQPTGFSAMAASFKTGGAQSQPTGRRAEKKPANKIPNIRLSFITAQDQAKFETLFKSAVGDGQMTMSGDKARDLLLRSRLDGDSLSDIWYDA
jgi:hypothetical protein